MTPAGGKFWRLAYRFGGKQKTLSCGSYPAVRLVDARERRDDARRQLRAGTDPGEARPGGLRAATSSTSTFEQVAREWYDAQKSAWVPAHAARVLSRFQRDVFPRIGARDVRAIEPPDILQLIRAIEARDALDVSKRVRQSIGAVFRFAIATGRAVRDPAADLAGALKRGPRVQHFAALKETELPAFLRSLENYEGELQTRLALRLTILTLLRTSEVRFARVEEFEHLDVPDQAMWRIPAERMKQGREHLVPLAPQAVEVVQQLRAQADGGPYLLPSSDKQGVISQNTMIFALYRLGYHSRATVHGFRRTASTILNEHGFNRDWIERQLSHADDDEVRSAYNSAEWLPGRRQMLVWWADHLDQLALTPA